MNMNPRVKAAWVAKLRDGRKQTTGVLEDNNGQCCLGVLCEVAVEAGVIPVPTRVSDTEDPEVSRDWHMVYDNSIAYDPDRTESAVLPSLVKEWAGVDAHNPTIPTFTRANGRMTKDVQLSWINDSGEGDFNTIADLIEEYL